MPGFVAWRASGAEPSAAVHSGLADRVRLADPELEVAADELATLAAPELQVVDHGAGGNRAQGQRVPGEDVGAGAGSRQVFVFGLLPRALPDMGAYAFYRFECALRSAAILGFFGFSSHLFQLG